MWVCLCVDPVVGVSVSLCCPCGGRYYGFPSNYSRNGSVQVAAASTTAAVDTEASVVVIVNSIVFVFAVVAMVIIIDSNIVTSRLLHFCCHYLN